MTTDEVQTGWTTNLSEELLRDKCDILWYNRIIDAPDGMAIVYALREKYGFQICVDVDDMWELDEFHISHKEYQEMNFAEKQVDHIRRADIVTTTHERLAAEIRQYNKNVHVLPNAIPRHGQFNIKKTFAMEVRLFWQGSRTHEEDIRILSRPIEALVPIAKRIKMVMAGYVRYEPMKSIETEEELAIAEEMAKEEHIWNQMVKVYTGGHKHQYKLFPNEVVTNYYGAYADADICLIPLVNTFFNRMKSNLKVLEAGNMGLPCVVSDVHPYKDLPVNYCKNSTEWIGHIKRLVQWPNRRKEEGERLQEFCLEHYNFYNINEHRRQIFEHAVKQKA